ncbi:MAG: hypothetical protein ACI8UO_004943 [Verrucomicrobiales bacterium]|jgi:hypothetical protein
MFEHRSQPLISKAKFARRIVVALFITGGLVVFSILIGMVGLQMTENLGWEKSFLRASLVLAEHDVHDHPESTAGIIFFGVYVLYARLIFVSLAAILLVPVGHRLFHHLHLEPEDEES